MIRRMLLALLVTVVVDVLLIARQPAAVPAAPQLPASASADERVDALFATFTRTTPGCSVGVSRDGRVVLEKAYGLADLERDVRNTPQTIFEAGSVAKQFTAAAVLLLAGDGKLSLDDPVRQYVPELPDYGVPLTIRHLLTHTSGLRDWGSIAGIGGWPRTTRVYTHAHVLEIVRSQRALNFTPGTNWSYSNTGFNLAAIIVSRVSGKSFAEFTRGRIFEPLGMTRTSWRDDHARIVKGRAVAYSATRDGFRTEMPFENVHGNGGLLTTVGDLLKWNENFVRPKVGDAGFVREMQEVGRLTDGRPHGYGLGLFIQLYHGVPEVSHGGSTAGYRAYLARYPEQHVSIAVLCNTGNANTEPHAHAVADLYLGLPPRPAPPAPVELPESELRAREGLWRSADTGEVIVTALDKNTLKTSSGQVLEPRAPGRYYVAGEGVVEFEGNDRLAATQGSGLVVRYDRVMPVVPTPAQLQELAGVYVSDEAEVAIEAVVEDGKLQMRRRPATAVLLQPLDADGFASAFGLVRFRRGEGGRVTGMSLTQDRVWDLRFRRQ